MPTDPIFLTAAAVLMIHADQMAAFGGAQGVRDPGLLASALAQPAATYGGEFLHRDLQEMAAAYLFHIVGNHPFVDGNKRTGLIAALVFLDLNGVDVQYERAELHDMTVAVAAGRLGITAVATELRRLFPTDTGKPTN